MQKNHNNQTPTLINDPALTVQECADLLGISDRAVYKHANEVRKDPSHVTFPTPFTVYRNHIRFRQSDVLKFKQGLLNTPRCGGCRKCGRKAKKAEARSNGPQQAASAKKPTAKKIANSSGRVNGCAR